MCISSVLRKPSPFKRLLQGQYPRHTLVKKSTASSDPALSAFNPPKDGASSSALPASSCDGRGDQIKVDQMGRRMIALDLFGSSFLVPASSSAVLKLSDPSAPSPDPPPVESRIKQDKSDFEEKERQREAQKVLAEKRQKMQVSTKTTATFKRPPVDTF